MKLFCSPRGGKAVVILKKRLLVLAALFLLSGCASGQASVEEFEPIGPLDLGDRSAHGIPDFLDEQQQIIYQNAYILYNALFVGGTGGIDSGLPVLYERTVEETSAGYVCSVGTKYGDWQLFDQTVHCAFTSEFWEEQNRFEQDGEPFSLYFERDGVTWYHDRGMGSGYYYNPNFEDQFELIEAADETIRFYIIGHYEWGWPFEGESFEERDRRLESTYSEQKYIPVTMVKTGEGWRFSEFSTPLAHE